jgi:acylphosphatase
MKRVLVRYSGRVQGVGFRATARRIAGAFEVSGWVKNTADGCVEMVVAADAAELEAFLKAIRDSHLGPKIDREVQESYENEAVQGDFDIRY